MTNLVAFHHRHSIKLSNDATTFTLNSHTFRGVSISTFILLKYMCILSILAQILEAAVSVQKEAPLCVVLATTAAAALSLKLCEMLSTATAVKVTVVPATVVLMMMTVRMILLLSNVVGKAARKVCSCYKSMHTSRML
jgi:hypothetical protein